MRTAFLTLHLLSMQRTPAASPKTLSKPGTPIKQEPPPVFDEVNNICPESPGPPPPSASLPGERLGFECVNYIYILSSECLHETV